MSVDEKNLYDLLYSLGAAILAWQSVENNLFLIFNFLVGPHRNPNVLSAAYHSVVNLNTRVEMIDAAAAVMLAETPHLDEWQKLSKRLKKNVGRRNALVHLGLVSYIYAKGKPPRLTIKPGIFDITQTPDLEYNLKQIQEWHIAFDELSRDLATWLTLCRGGIEPPGRR